MGVAGARMGVLLTWVCSICAFHIYCTQTDINTDVTVHCVIKVCSDRFAELRVQFSALHSAKGQYLTL